MTTDIRRISIPKHKRIIAISDIHANLRLLDDLLIKIGFCGDDELFVIGDHITRGPENLAALRFLMELDKNENVHVMMGNMEYWHCSLIQNDTPAGHKELLGQTEALTAHFGHCLFADMLDELGITANANSMPEAFEAIKSAFARELEYMRTLPVIIETDHLIFVHGGIPSEDLGSLSKLDPLQFLKNDDFMNKGISFSKYVIVGHWPATNYCEDHMCHMPHVNHSQRIITIDGGCGIKRGAQLNAFIITDERGMEYSVEYSDGLPVKTASEPQAESESYMNIRYGDHQITILEKGALESYVEHESTGSRLWVPNSNMWFEGDQACCVHSNYMLPVEKGDSLGVIMETASGYMVKKNGLCGWYRGTFTN